MRVWVQVDAEGRVLAASEDVDAVSGGVAAEAPDDFDWSPDWRLVGGELVCDPLPEPPMPPALQALARQAEFDDALCAIYEMQLGGE